MFEIGKRIKTLRQQKGWSQSDIAKLLNISVPAFSKIESDITDVNISRLNQIAETFGVPVIDLISTQVEPPSQSLLDELKEAKDTIAVQSAKINQLQEYIITLYEQLHKKNAQDVINS